MSAFLILALRLTPAVHDRFNHRFLTFFCYFTKETIYNET